MRAALVNREGNELIKRQSQDKTPLICRWEAGWFTGALKILIRRLWASSVGLSGATYRSKQQHIFTLSPLIKMQQSPWLHTNKKLCESFLLQIIDPTEDTHTSFNNNTNKLLWNLTQKHHVSRTPKWSVNVQQVPQTACTKENQLIPHTVLQLSG